MATRPTPTVSPSNKKIPKKSGKKTKCVCPICEDNIDDSVHDSIFCEGYCQAWVHRGCGGLSKPAHAKAKSIPSWKCPSCLEIDHSKVFPAQSELVENLKKDLSALTQQVNSLDAKVVSLAEELSSISTVPSATTPLSSLSPSNGHIPATTSLMQSAQQRNSDTRPMLPAQQRNPDRKYNVIISGINESPAGTACHIRISNDLNSVSSVLSLLLPTLSDTTIRDCHRLGKFSPNHSRNILVTFNRTCDVSTVLSNKFKVADRSSLKINPDLSPSDRKIRSILLSKRHELIRSGFSRQSIHFRSNIMFVDGRKFGAVINQRFESSSPPGSPSHPMNITTHQTSPSDPPLLTLPTLLFLPLPLPLFLVSLLPQPNPLLLISSPLFSTTSHPTTALPQ